MDESLWYLLSVLLGCPGLCVILVVIFTTPGVRPDGDRRVIRAKKIFYGSIAAFSVAVAIFIQVGIHLRILA
ncbi:hypothetical protein KW790_01995 [Candidatus Parcubacteria bacterium]|nr:hypothetical protein [Candidatus Parcubacteria bacterium]